VLDYLKTNIHNKVTLLKQLEKPNAILTNMRDNLRKILDSEITLRFEFPSVKPSDKDAVYTFNPEQIKSCVKDSREVLKIHPTLKGYNPYFNELDVLDQLKLNTQHGGTRRIIPDAILLTYKSKYDRYIDSLIKEVIKLPPQTTTENIYENRNNNKLMMNKDGIHKTIKYPYYEYFDHEGILQFITWVNTVEKDDHSTIFVVCHSKLMEAFVHSLPGYTNKLPACMQKDRDDNGYELTIKTTKERSNEIIDNVSIKDGIQKPDAKTSKLLRLRYETHCGLPGTAFRRRKKYVLNRGITQRIKGWFTNVV
jgi:hypothetical protein